MKKVSVKETGYQGKNPQNKKFEERGCHCILERQT